MRVRTHALFLAAFVCWGAHAEEGKYSPAYTACQDKSGGVDAAMLACIKDEYQLQDKRLNDSYHQLMASLPSSRRSALKTAQRDWLKSRRSTCDFYFKVAGGTMVSLVSQSCYLDATVERVEQLDYWKTLHAE